MGHDLSIFMAPLEAQGEPGLSAIDTRLNAVTDLAEQRKFAEAAAMAEPIHQEGVYDIRTISIYLLGALLDDGFVALGGVCDALGSLLGPNLAAVGPAKRREDQFNRRMAWLFDTSRELFAYHQGKHTDEWQRWSKGASAEALAPSVQSIAALSKALGADAFKGAHMALNRLRDWLLAVIASRKEPEAPPASVGRKAPPPGPAAAPAPAAPAVPLDSLEPVRRRVELEVSHRFLELLAKLKAFEALIAKKQFDRAALVAEDLKSQIDQFDPRDYFPDLFARFSSLNSKHIDPLSSHASNQDSEAWKALAQFYRVDLKGFVDGLGRWSATPLLRSSTSRSGSRRRPAAST